MVKHFWVMYVSKPSTVGFLLWASHCLLRLMNQRAIMVIHDNDTTRDTATYMPSADGFAKQLLANAGNDAVSLRCYSSSSHHSSANQSNWPGHCGTMFIDSQLVANLAESPILYQDLDYSIAGELGNVHARGSPQPSNQRSSRQLLSLWCR